MPESIREVMTPDPVTVDRNTTAREVARVMRDNDIGDVIVMAEGKVQGILTDRDIVVRAVADDPDPEQVEAQDICSSQLTHLSPGDTVAAAVHAMRENAVRRLPVLDDDGRPVGIVSLGDLAIEQDPDSALGDISAAPPNV